MTAAELYGARPVKRRRRTRAELDEIDGSIVQAVEEDKPVTLRGVYYRVVSAGGIEKTEAGYDVILRELLLLRRAGVISYADIIDGTRFVRNLATWDGVEDALRDTAATYRRALWRNQDCRVLVLTEKDAISGVIQPVTDLYDVPLGVMRGYASESFAWQAAQMICAWPGAVYAYQLGDHDPSGVDAWRSFQERVWSFVDDAIEGGECRADLLSMRRLAVTEEDIDALNLPTRPTKMSDTRAAGFRGESVEIDAIPANRLRSLVRDAIEYHLDPEALRITRVAEESEREVLYRIAGAAS